MIDAEYAIPSPFTIPMYQWVFTGNDTIFVNMVGGSTSAASGSLVAQIGLLKNTFILTILLAPMEKLIFTMS